MAPILNSLLFYSYNIQLKSSRNSSSKQKEGKLHYKEGAYITVQRIYTVKKVRKFFVPSRDVTTKLSLGGNNDVITELFLPRGSLVSYIPAGDGKLVNLFYGVGLMYCPGILEQSTVWGLRPQSWNF